MTTTHTQAFLSALALAVNAPSEARAADALRLAESFAASLTPEELHAAIAEADRVLGTAGLFEHLTMKHAAGAITDAQIEALQIEAGAAGDDAMIEICRIALGEMDDQGAAAMTRDEARATCARVIADARAMRDD